MAHIRMRWDILNSTNSLDVHSTNKNKCQMTCGPLDNLIEGL